MIFYEDLVRSPGEQITRIERHLATRGGRAWQAVRIDRSMVDRPSFASFRRQSATTAERLEPWRDAYQPEVIDAAMAILSDRGLAGLYGSSAAPLVAGEDAVAAVQ